MKTRKLQGFLFAVLVLFGIPQYAGAVLITTTPGDDSVLESIQGFDAGSLGIADIDFGGNTFNKAFGTDPTPSGYLFSATRNDGLALIASIQSLLNDYNASATTNITRIMNQISGTGVDTPPYINVAYDVRSTTVGLWQINSGGAMWADPYRGNDFSRDTFNFVYARLTRATDVPEPAALALFGIGLAGLGFARRKKST